MSGHGFAARTATALTTGSCVDAGYSRREFALTLHTSGGFVTLAACRFDDPTRSMSRALRAFDRGRNGS